MITGIVPMLFSTALFSGKLFNGLLFKVISIGEKITDYGNVLSKTISAKHVRYIEHIENIAHVNHVNKKHIEHARHHKHNSNIKIQNDALMAIIMSKLK